MKQDFYDEDHEKKLDRASILIGILIGIVLMLALVFLAATLYTLC